MNDDQGRRRGDNKTSLGENEVAACPECDAPNVEMGNLNDISGPRAYTERYICSACAAKFDEYVVREKRFENGLHGLPGRLLDADPDEVSR